MEIYFLKEDFSLLDGPIDSFTSVVWYERFFETGTFVLHFPVALLKRTLNAAYVCTSVVDGEVKCGRVEYLSTEEDGICKMGGRLIECILADRIMGGSGVYSGTVTEAVTSAVAACFGEGDVTIGECDIISDSVNLTYSWNNLSEWVYSVLKPYGASYSVKPDPETGLPVFRIVRGEDRTAGEKAAVFSSSFGNITSINMDIDRSSMKNFAYVQGKDGTVVTVDNSGGRDKREMFVKADDIAPGGFPTSEEYTKALKKRGAEKLAKHPEGFALSAECAANSLPRYGKDYFIGDICDVADDMLGVSFGMRLTAVDTVWENGVCSVYPLFGEEIRYISKLMGKI